MQQQLVKHLASHFAQSSKQMTELDRGVFYYLREGRLPRGKHALSINSEEKNPTVRIKIWRDLLKATMLCSLKDYESEKKRELKESWYALSSTNSLGEFQLEQAYCTLVAHLLGISYTPKKDWAQLPSGLTPIESGGHWSLMNTPLLEWHAELGTLWVILGKRLSKPSYISLAQKLAYWQTKTLDHNYQPHKGFLSSHHLSHYTESALRQAVLFHAVALATADPQMAFLAKHHFSRLLEVDEGELEGLSSDACLVLHWIDLLFNEELTPQEPTFKKQVQDQSLAIAGYRSEKISLITSMIGANMGLGSLRCGDIEIPAMGPQMEILGEGKLFGILGQNPLKDSDEELFQVDFDENEFHLKGRVGLPKKEDSKEYFQMWNKVHSWMDLNLFFEEGALNIEATPYQSDSKLFFVFYAGAQKCLIGGEEKILPHSLNQFQGPAAPVTLVGNHNILILDTLGQELELKIIPLEGHHSFWGANYLIAYHLNNKYSTFKWKISPRDL